MLSRTPLRTALICRQCLLTRLPTFQPPSQAGQLRFLKKQKKDPTPFEDLPDHVKKGIMGQIHEYNPESGKINLSEIEMVRGFNLKKLKAHSKGALYQASIHGKAEMVQETMRAYDRYR